MDDTVLRAMAKWPDVPNAYGWLALDARGLWRLKGERIGNAGLVDFIGRNYASDERGRWYFQNGPQRVFVKLELTPWIYALDDAGGLVTHTGIPATDIAEAFLDDAGHVLLRTALGIGALIDRDLPLLARCFVDERGAAPDDAALLNWLDGGGAPMGLRLGARELPVGRVDVATLATRFGFVADPRPDPGEPEC